MNHSDYKFIDITHNINLFVCKYEKQFSLVFYYLAKKTF